MERRKFLAGAIVAGTVLSTSGTLATIPADQKPYVLKSGKSRFNEQTSVGGSNDIKVSAKDTNGSLSFFEFNGVVKGGPPLHVHPNQDEIFMVQQGDYLFQVGTERYNLTAGDTIFLPRNIPQAFAQLTDRGKMIYFFTPAGKMEDFFRTLGVIKGVPAPDVAAKIFADHDMKVVGPPLAI